MKHEVRDIPPAPRRIHLRPLFAHHWLLFAAGSVLVVIGGLAGWLMFLQSGGKMSFGPRLDAGPTSRITGTLQRVDAPRQFDGRTWMDVRYDFTFRGSDLRGGCFVPAGPWQVGNEVTVEVLDGDSDVSRIAGGVLHFDRDWLRARFWITVLVVPGALLLLGWLAGAFQLRQVLVHGDVSIGTVHRVVRVPFVLPEMLRVDYTFRDHRATTRHNHHWVRVHGTLGARLLQQLQQHHYEEMPVLHDRRLPHWNRMLLPQDFWPQPPIDLEPADRTSSPS